MVGITVLGPLSVNGSGPFNRRDRVVLETLAMRPGHSVSADQLGDALWGDSPPASAAKSLQGCVVRLRKVLGPDAIKTVPHGYALTVPPDQLDAERFERLVGRARELLTLGEADRAGYQLTEALSLWRGEPFEDLDGWAPAVPAVRRLGELRLEAEELRIDAFLRAGRHREVLAEAQSMVRAAPLRERRWTLLAQAQYQAGQQGESLRTIHRLKSVLSQQLGIDPGQDVAELEGAILRQDASLSAVAVPLARSRATCPYQGLRAYDLDDADRFFGRQDDVDACLEILQRTSLLALVGPSGCGKSSILRAGVASALRSRGRRTLTITPGPHPMQELTALPEGQRDIVLLVDQAEELFAVCEDPAERREFLDALADESRPRTVILALRADRLADLTMHPAVSRLVEQGLYLVGGLSEEGLHEAIETPALQAGLAIEPGLVDLLVREVRDDPGALPLLSHALLETWKRREGNTLTVAGYRASGGIHGAVAQSAERLYAQTDPEDRPLLRDLVLRLVSPGTSGEPVRSRVPLRLIATDKGRDQLLERLVAARLVTSDDGVLEITHEALARAWPRLRGWLDDDIEGQRMLHHLASAADAWDSLGRPDSELYRGVRLVRALDWQGRTRSSLTGTERDFLEAARRNAEAEEQSVAAQAHAQARMIRRLRAVLAGAAVLLVAALVAGMLAVQQGRAAHDNAIAAGRAEDAAVARRAGANAQVTGDVDESLLLAVAGTAIDDSPDTRFNVLAAIQRYPQLFATTRMPGNGQVLSVAANPDGSTVATMDDLHRVRLFDAASGALDGSYQAGRPSSPNLFEYHPPLEFAPDGQVLAVANSPLRGEPVTLLDSRTLEPLGTQPGGQPTKEWLASDLAFSSDGRFLTAALQHYTRPQSESVATGAVLLVWETASLERPRRVKAPGKDLQSVVLSPDGSLLYSSLPLVRHDLSTGESTALKASDVSNLTMSPDGRLLAGSEYGRLVLVDGKSGRPMHRLGDFGESVAVQFSPDGRALAATSWGDRTLTVWDVTGRRPDVQQQFTMGRGPAAGFEYAPDGSFLYAAEGGAALRRWDLTGARRLLSRVSLRENRGAAFAVVAPGGRHAVFLAGGSGDEGGFSFQDLESGATTHQIMFGSGYRHTYGAWHPDGRHFVSAIGGLLKVWDVNTGELGRQKQFTGKVITEIDFSPDASRLVVSERSGRVTMLDGSTMGRVGTPVDVGEPVLFVSASPDNRTAAVLTGGPAADRFWQRPSTGWALVDLEAGRVIDRGKVGFGSATWLAYSPDGRHFAISGGDGSEFLSPTGAKGELVVISSETGTRVRPPVVGHAGAVYHLAYSPDGTRILSSSLDGTVGLWNALTGRLLARVNVEGRPFISAEFLPGGTAARILEWQSGRAYTWDLDTERAIERACTMVGRNFTQDEWRLHFGGRPYQKVCDL